MTGSEPGFRRGLVFRLIYLPLALLYAAVILYWGRYDLQRLYHEYQLAAERPGHGYAQVQAGQEIAEGCRQAAGGETAPGYGECLKASARLVEVRAAVITGELLREKQRAGRKLAVFYTLVFVLMLALPLTLLYLLLAFLSYLPGNIRLRKE